MKRDRVRGDAFRKNNRRRGRMFQIEEHCADTPASDDEPLTVRADSEIVDPARFAHETVHTPHARRIKDEDGVFHMEVGRTSGFAADENPLTSWLDRQARERRAFRELAYLATVAEDPAFKSIELAKENAKLAEDLGADQENKYVQALICLAENDKSAAAKFLTEAASRGEFGFGGQFFRRELARLTGMSRKVIVIEEKEDGKKERKDAK